MDETTFRDEGIKKVQKHTRAMCEQSKSEKIWQRKKEKHVWEGERVLWDFLKTIYKRWIRHGNCRSCYKALYLPGSSAPKQTLFQFLSVVISLYLKAPNLVLQYGVRKMYANFQISLVTSVIWAVQLDHFKLFLETCQVRPEDMPEVYSGPIEQETCLLDFKWIGRWHWCRPLGISKNTSFWLLNKIWEEKRHLVRRKPQMIARNIKYCRKQAPLAFLQSKCHFVQLKTLFASWMF